MPKVISRRAVMDFPSPFHKSSMRHRAAPLFSRVKGHVQVKRRAEHAYRKAVFPGWGAKTRMPAKRMLSFVHKHVDSHYVPPKRPRASNVRKFYNVSSTAPSSPHYGNFASGGMYYRLKEQFMKALKDASDAVSWAEKLQKKIARINGGKAPRMSKPRVSKSTAPSSGKVITAALQLTNQTQRGGIVVPRATPTSAAVKHQAKQLLHTAAKHNPGVHAVVKSVKKQSKLNGAAFMEAPRRSSRLSAR